MSCTRPITAQQYYCAQTGKVSVRLAGEDFKPNLELKCNVCPSCRMAKAREWALRCWHESQMHEHNSFITLTYRDADLPKNNNLNHADFQKFMKRLRFNTGEKIRYYMCGEYGDQTHRPHYHALIFGWWPPDAKYFCTRNNNRVYTSELLNTYWGKGLTEVGTVSYKSAGYCARYLIKKQISKEALQDRYIWADEDGVMHVRNFEYVRMSLDPGIGLSWFEKYKKQTIDHDFVRNPDGHEMPVPRYYLNQLKLEDPETFERLKQARIEKAQNNPDNSPDRLAAREICAKAKLKLLPRPYL